MKLYFIIPVYNVEIYLKRCIDSVLNQEFIDIGIILVDDGSTDISGKICDEYAEKYENIKVIHKENGGLSSSRNAGLDYLCGIAEDTDFVSFVDSDDYIRHDFARKMVLGCLDNNCKAAQCSYEKGSSDEFTEYKTDINIYIKKAEDMLCDQKLKSQAWAKVFRYDCIGDLRFQENVWNEDEFLTYKLIYNSEYVLRSNERMYYYYQRPGSIMTKIAKKMKGNPHIFDWLDAYKERIAFFKERNKEELVLRTYEKICTDVILRYCEQMYLKPEERDAGITEGIYLKLYREYYPKAIKRKGISLKRRLMYFAFNCAPISAVIVSKIFGLRK